MPVDKPLGFCLVLAVRGFDEEADVSLVATWTTKGIIIQRPLPMDPEAAEENRKKYPVPEGW